MNCRSFKGEFELLKQQHMRRSLSSSWRIAQKFARSHPPARSISSAVVCLPNENRTAELARSIGNPIASKTCDATTEPTMQADPLDAQTPSKSSAISSVSESNPGKLTFSVFGKAVHWIAILLRLGKI